MKELADFKGQFMRLYQFKKQIIAVRVLHASLFNPAIIWGEVDQANLFGCQWHLCQQMLKHSFRKVGA